MSTPHIVYSAAFGSFLTPLTSITLIAAHYNWCFIFLPSPVMAATGGLVQNMKRRNFKVHKSQEFFDKWQDRKQHQPVDQLQTLIFRNYNSNEKQRYPPPTAKYVGCWEPFLTIHPKSSGQQIPILTQPMRKGQTGQVSGVIFQKHKWVHDGQMSGPLDSGQGHGCRVAG